MIAEDGVMEFPYSPPGFPTRLDGQLAIAGHLERLSSVISFDRMGKAVVHATIDPDRFVIEFEGFGQGVATGDAYDQQYISVIQTKNGRIVHYRDYWNPLAVLRATRGAVTVDAFLAGEARHG